MNISVLTADQTIFNGEVTSVKVPGANGEFQVLNNHAPVVSALIAGKVTIKVATGTSRSFNEESGKVTTKLDSAGNLVFSIEKGFIEVLNNEISLLVQGVNM